MISDLHYQSTLDAVYVYVVPWLEFPIVPSYPHYPLTPRFARNPLSTVAPIRQSRPDAGLGFQVEALETFDRLWAGFRESRRCSRDTYPESCITEYILIYEDEGVRSTLCSGLSNLLLLSLHYSQAQS